VELGRLDLSVDPNKRQIIEYQWRRIAIDTRTFQPDKRVAGLVSKWESKVAAKVDIPIGVAKRAFDQRAVKTMLEQAMMGAVGAEIAYMNPGGVRDGLPKGQILARHVWNIMPFDNVTVYDKIKGKRIPREAAAGHTIRPEQEYTFATNDFIADQWKATGLRFTRQGPPVRDALIDWIKARKILE
jgi:2',3'-cyclic-nucleotide 2'-phosphodiesterase (5'-nucleotidase family)